MMRSVAAPLEKHHKVQLLDEAIQAAVRFSHRYIPARQLPDKSVSLLDTACARVAVSQSSTPPAVDDVQKRIAALQIELGVIGRERAIGIDTTARLDTATQALEQETQRLAALEERWKTEGVVVKAILEQRMLLRDASPMADLSALRALQVRLAALQGETNLVSPGVDRQAVAAVGQDWTGVPVPRQGKGEVDKGLR